MKKLVRMAMVTLSLAAFAIFIVPMITEDVHADTVAPDTQIEQQINDDVNQNQGTDQNQDVDNSTNDVEAPAQEPGTVSEENLNEDQNINSEKADVPVANATVEQKLESENMDPSKGETPVAVFKNQLEYISAKLGDSITVILKNRTTTNCGVNATIKVGLGTIELFNGILLDQVGNGGSEKTASFTAISDYFAEGDNYLKVIFDYGTEPKTIIPLCLTIIGTGNNGIKSISENAAEQAAYSNAVSKEKSDKDDSSTVTAAATDAGVKTGDNSPLMMVIMLMMIALLGAIAVARRQEN